MLAGFSFEHGALSSWSPSHRGALHQTPGGMARAVSKETKGIAGSLPSRLVPTDNLGKDPNLNTGSWLAALRRK